MVPNSFVLGICLCFGVSVVRASVSHEDIADKTCVASDCGGLESSSVLLQHATLSVALLLDGALAGPGGPQGAKGPPAPMPAPTNTVVVPGTPAATPAPTPAPNNTVVVPSSRLLVSGTALATSGDHPMLPTCFGYGGDNCTSALPGGQSGAAWQSFTTCQTLAIRLPPPSGCSQRACWMQKVRVAVDSSTLTSKAKAGVYASNGVLLAASQVVIVQEGLGPDKWIDFNFKGLGFELLTGPDAGDLWLAVQFQSRASLVYDSTTDESQASYYANEEWDETVLAARRVWENEAGRRSWSSTFRRYRAQLIVGDITLLPGTLPVVLEAPHGGRITTGWPERNSGTKHSDTHTDLFAEMLRDELGLRCGGRKPQAVIFRVHRQGVDANRALGGASLTVDNTSCSDESSGQCCCDLTDSAAHRNALDVTAAYHEQVLAAMQEAGAGSFLLSVHAVGSRDPERLEVGVRLSATRLNTAAARQPPSMHASDWQWSTLRALGSAGAEQEEMIWGSSGIGARLAQFNPGLAVIPAPNILCPDLSICNSSTDSSYFSGGHVLKIATNEMQPGAQLELPPSVRNRDGPSPESSNVRRIAAALASFFNEHLPVLGDLCSTDVNLGVSCGNHGVADAGECICNTVYAGEFCEECVGGFMLDGDGSCQHIATLGTPESLPGQKHAWLYESYSGKQYQYWRRVHLSSDLEACGIDGCQPLHASLKVYCDGPDCHTEVADGSYQVGIAMYALNGTKLCQALSALQSPRPEKDWWLQIPTLHCPPLQDLTASGAAHMYLSFWTTKKLRLRWVEPTDISDRAHACRYDEDAYAEDLTSRSADDCVDQVAAGNLPTWREDACEDLAISQCRSWTSDGARHYYAPMIQLAYITS